MTTYWHVAATDYQAGDDLLSFDELEARGDAPVWKWSEENGGSDEMIDTDVVCLFQTRAEAEEFISTWLPDGQLLQIDVPDDGDHHMTLTRVSEGYPAVFRRIPADLIRIM